MWTKRLRTIRSCSSFQIQVVLKLVQLNTSQEHHWPSLHWIRQLPNSIVVSEGNSSCQKLKPYRWQWYYNNAHGSNILESWGWDISGQWWSDAVIQWYSGQWCRDDAGMQWPVIQWLMQWCSDQWCSDTWNHSRSMNWRELMLTGKP